ncbi:MAG: protein-glutamate O-methyltransferase CheR [Vicinamibacterales bacterium]
MNISPQDFDYIRSFVFDQAGIVLEVGKQYLVESRLGPIAKQFKLESMADLANALKGRDLVLRRAVVEAMTTNETTFFRDAAPFDTLRDHIIPRLMEARASTRQLKIWYGASSTGQEPYSVVMMLMQHYPQLESWKVTHYATDINLDVLERARQGRFNQVEMNRGLPATYLVKYFEKVGTEWQLKQAVRDRVKFEQLNLVKPWQSMQTFDIIMLRNVMIYFDVDAKKQILAKLERQLAPDGYLFLGGAETTMGLTEAFKRMQYERAGCYCKVGAAEAAPRKGAA